MSYVDGSTLPTHSPESSPPLSDAGLAGGILAGAIAAEAFIPEGSYLRYFAGAVLVVAAAKLFYNLDRNGDI
jgi:hypothetical protein